jgi:hypothetical protein
MPVRHVVVVHPSCPWFVFRESRSLSLRIKKVGSSTTSNTPVTKVYRPFFGERNVRVELYDSLYLRFSATWHFQRQCHPRANLQWVHRQVDLKLLSCRYHPLMLEQDDSNLFSVVSVELVRERRRSIHFSRSQLHSRLP